jgi:hypothetical protein
MIDNRFGDESEDEFGDVADDVIYVDEDDEDASAGQSIWASVVTGAHYAFRWGRGRPGGAHGTGAG